MASEDTEPAEDIPSQLEEDEDEDPSEQLPTDLLEEAVNVFFGSGSGDDEDDEYELDEDEDEDEDSMSELETTVPAWFGYRRTRPPAELLSQFRKLPVPFEPLCNDLSLQVNLDTAGANTRGPPIPGSLDAGRDPLHPNSPRHSHQHTKAKRTRSSSIERPQTRSQPPHPQRSHSDTGGRGADTDAPTRRSSRSGSGADGRASDPGASTSAGPPAPTDSGFRVLNTAKLLLKRELALGTVSGFSRQQQRHLHCYRNMPHHPTQIMDSQTNRAYIGQYSSDGKFFVAAYQDRRVRLYDCSNKWALRKDVTTRMTRWTITDTTLSPDQRFLVYASITPVAYLVHVGSNLDVVESMANVTDLHDALQFDNMPDAGQRAERTWGGHFGIWSIAWSPAGGEIIAGTNDHCVYVYDIQSGRSHLKLSSHQDDVNAVAYLDGGAGQGGGNIIASGSDDSLVRIWDRRLASANTRTPVGVFLGHTEGVTHIDARGDGRHLISNAKDQSVKLWDLRKGLLSPQQARALPTKRVPSFHWDYRMEPYPAAGYEVLHPHDQSLATYRGHSVIQTLIRAYFSPAFTTGQRYIYAGSASGGVCIWDAVTSKLVSRLAYHRAPVRDVSWHPYEAELVSTSWDGSLMRWTSPAPGGEEGPPTKSALPPPRRDQANFY